MEKTGILNQNGTSGAEAGPECMVCFEFDADTIFMNCGHGGICIRCAHDVWLSADECYLCRQTIEFLLRFDPRDRRKDTFRVIEEYRGKEEKEYVFGAN